MTQHDSTLMKPPRALLTGFDSVGVHLKHYSFTVAICFGIAILLWMFSDDPFVEHLVFSLSIGLSIHTFTMIAIYFVRTRPIWQIWAVTVPCGVVAGLAVGARLNGMSVGAVLSGGGTFMSLTIALIASYVFYSYYQIIEMGEQLREEELNRVQYEKRLVETQLRLLQSQVEPHFLFNTLSHVVSLIGTDADKAQVMLQKLTQFLRASLRRSRAEHATLQDELDLLNDYLAILAIRMGGRLDYAIEANVDAEALELPPLILQPLVENAVVHGLEPLEEGGRLTISVTERNASLIVTIEDTGVGLDEDASFGVGHSGEGMGIVNVKERLRRLYGGNARLELTDVEPHGLRVTVSIPLAEIAS